jgi:hypothetical protein
MLIEPRTTDEIYDSVRQSLEESADSIDRFSDGSFNDAFLTAYAEQARESEIKAVVALLASTVRYAGKEITQSDLQTLGIQNVTPEEVNEYVRDEHLDLQAANFGVQRGSGSRATTTLEFTVGTDTTEIAEGTRVSTGVGARETTLDFLVDVDGDGVIATDNPPVVTPTTGDVTVQVPAIAADVGTQYNVSVDSINRLAAPDPGIESVTNVTVASGGEDPQTNESLREETLQALFESPGGGTVTGMESYIEDNSSSVLDAVSVRSRSSQDPPFIDVVVSGGDPAELRRLIDESKPVGMSANLLRPTVVRIGVDADTRSFSEYLVDESTAYISSFFEDLEIGDNLYQSELIGALNTANESIVSVPTSNVGFDVVEEERFLYDSTVSDYELTYGPMGRVTDEKHVAVDFQSVYELMYHGIDSASVSVDLVDGQETRSLSSSDFSVVSTRTDSSLNAIELASGVSITSERAELVVSYSHSSWSVTDVSIPGGRSFVKNTDYEVVDTTSSGRTDSIRWLSADSPADGERFQVTYEPRRNVTTDTTVSDSSVLRSSTDRISFTNYLL